MYDPDQEDVWSKVISIIENTQKPHKPPSKIYRRRGPSPETVGFNEAKSEILRRVQEAQKESLNGD